jgi:hypothetical protein
MSTTTPPAGLPHPPFGATTTPLLGLPHPSWGYHTPLGATTPPFEATTPPRGYHTPPGATTPPFLGLPYPSFGATTPPFGATTPPAAVLLDAASEQSMEEDVRAESAEPVYKLLPIPPPWSSHFSDNYMRVLCTFCFSGNRDLRNAKCSDCYRLEREKFKKLKEAMKK